MPIALNLGKAFLLGLAIRHLRRAVSIVLFLFWLRINCVPCTGSFWTYYPDGTQSTFTANIADAGAPDARTLVEATRSPDWPTWEKTIEEQLHAYKARPVAQGLSQMSGVDTHAKVASVSANLGHAHWEAVEQTLHHLSGTPDLPPTHVEGSGPSEGHANTSPDGDMAKYRHAISGHASLTDGGAVPWSSKRQDTAPSESLTTESDHIAATTHSGKEASWLRSPAPDISDDLKGPTTISDITAANALMRDHQYHTRTKPIDMRHHWTQWTTEQALPSAKVKHFAAGLGLLAK